MKVKRIWLLQDDRSGGWIMESFGANRYEYAAFPSTWFVAKEDDRWLLVADPDA